MYVYRICKGEEIQSILKNKSFDDVGCSCVIDSKLNNHNYITSIKYVHFFEDYDSIFYLNVTRGYYICTYNIPNDILEKHKGIGNYLDRMFMEKLECVTEYAVPNECLKFEYLQKVDKVVNFVEFEDFLYDEYDNKVSTVYEVSKKDKTYLKQYT